MKNKMLLIILIAFSPFCWAKWALQAGTWGIESEGTSRLYLQINDAGKGLAWPPEAAESVFDVALVVEGNTITLQSASIRFAFDVIEDKGEYWTLLDQAGNDATLYLPQELIDIRHPKKAYSQPVGQWELDSIHDVTIILDDKGRVSIYPFLQPQNTFSGKFELNGDQVTIQCPELNIDEHFTIYDDNSTYYKMRDARSDVHRLIYPKPNASE